MDIRQEPEPGGARATEPLVLGAAAAILAGTAAVATLIPAWRALRVSPRAALTEP